MIAKFEWTEDEAITYNAVLSNMGILGQSIGSLCGGYLLPFGRRKIVLVMNVCFTLAVALTLIEQFVSICIGKFFIGFSASLMQMCSIKAVFETVPGRMSGFFGTSTNIGIAVGGITTVLFGGAILPASADDYKED